MKTILGFDSWTAARDKYIQLIEPLQELGYRLILVHIGSWGPDPGQPKEEIDRGLTIRDICFYHKKDLHCIFAEEDPAAVLFLSTRAFAHEIVNLYARQRRIPTMHMYHGLVTVQNFADSKVVHKTNWLNSFRRILRQGSKNIFTILPQYYKCLRTVDVRGPYYIDIFKEIFHKVRGTTTGAAPLASQTDAGIVYVQSDLDHMVETYHVAHDAITVVGNPDLMKFSLRLEEIGSSLEENTVNAPDIIYIETALLEVGAVFANQNEVVRHLTEVALAAEAMNKRLLFKPHPSSWRNGLAKAVQDKGIALVENEDFVEVLKNSAGAIVNTSSAAMIAALLGVPVLLAGFGKLQGQSFGLPLIRYPRSDYIADLDQLAPILAELGRPHSRSDFDKWAADYAGPLPAEQMPQRAAAALHRLVSGGHAQE